MSLRKKKVAMSIYPSQTPLYPPSTRENREPPPKSYEECFLDVFRKVQVIGAGFVNSNESMKNIHPPPPQTPQQPSKHPRCHPRSPS